MTPTTNTARQPGASWPMRGWHDGDEKLLREIDDLAFGYSAPEERWAEELATLERDRMVFVADPADPAAIIGSAGAFTFEVSVPGGRSVAAAGVSWVSVYPTHRRRGILRALMTAQLADIAARHEPVAVLWCSEATIYGRFGYGRATSEAEVTVDRHRAAIEPALVAAAGLHAEIRDPADSLIDVEALYETIRAVRPGMPRRSAAWQRTAIGDYDSQRAGASKLRTVLFRDEGGTVRAAIRYRVEGWAAETATSPRRTRVSELYADSPGASATAWSWIGELDLVGGYRAGSRPVDDPLLLQLSDLRAAKVEPGDALWVRLVDLPAALASRGYGATTEAVVDVTDATLPANAGHWRVSTTTDGAQVTRTDEPADLSLDTSVLAEAYLGSAGSLVRSLRAGRVTEHRPGAVSALSRAFDSDLAPWCPVHF